MFLHTFSHRNRYESHNAAWFSYFKMICAKWCKIDGSEEDDDDVGDGGDVGALNV